MKVESREYKLLVNHEPFANPSAAVKAVWDEIEEAVKTLPMVRTKDKLNEKETRSIIFLDTPDHTLRRNGLVLRQRAVDEAVEYTLKCRSEDRYFAAGTDVGAADRLKSDPKLEEDIAPPFRCRFSHSTTITVAGDRKTTLQKTPKTLGEATAFFPVLGTLRADGRPCDPETTLEAVNSITVDESVWKGGKIVFEPNDEEKSDNGWKLADKAKNKVPLSGTIPAGGTVLINVKAPVQLSNQGGIITLLNASGLKVHGVSYTKAQAKEEGETIVFGLT